MSYVVLARRYRPQNFADLVGQEHVANTLKNAVSQKRFAHAYLFTGPRGVGKTSAARILAKAIRCLDPQDGEPCNKCEACVNLNEGKSMDVIEIDAASNTGVDNIRELRENVEYMASVGKYRVYIIDEVHMLSTAAFNALLKTLEEPPPHVIFVFATTELHKVLPTIQSRCQKFDFRRIPFAEMLQNLKEICDKEKVEIDEASLKTISLESEGCLRDAQSLLDQAIAFCNNKITIDLLESALGLVGRNAYFDLFSKVRDNNTAEALSAVHKMLKQGNDPKILLNRATQFFRDLHFAFFAKEFPTDDPELVQIMKTFCDVWSTDQVVRALDLCLRHQSQLYGASHTEYLLESLVVKLTLQRPAMASQQIAAPQTNARAAAPAARPAPTPTSAKPTSSYASRAATRTPQTNVSQETPPAAPAASAGDADLRSTFERYLRQNKPAWMPVLQSLIGIQSSPDGNIVATAKADFAGRRLASNDGIEILKLSFGAQNVEVKLGGTPVASNAASQDAEDPYKKMRETRDMAREHESVQAAVRIFDARITDTKVLINENKRPTGKGDKT